VVCRAGSPTLCSTARITLVGGVADMEGALWSVRWPAALRARPRAPAARRTPDTDTWENQPNKPRRRRTDGRRQATGATPGRAPQDPGKPAVRRRRQNLDGHSCPGVRHQRERPGLSRPSPSSPKAWPRSMLGPTPSKARWRGASRRWGLGCFHGQPRPAAELYPCRVRNALIVDPGAHGPAGLGDAVDHCAGWRPA